MKNVWIELSHKKNPKHHVSKWLESSLDDNNELAYALYNIIETVYTFYGIGVGGATLLIDKDDAVQECVLAMLKYLDVDDPNNRLFSLFHTMTTIVVKELNDLSTGLNTQPEDISKMERQFYNTLKLDKKL